MVIGAQEYSSNHFPWRQLAHKGYDVRQVPFRNGGLDPGAVAEQVDTRTKLVAFSGVQTASGHRSDIAAISGVARAVGAVVFVDGAQLVGALPVAHDLPYVDVLAAPDHKFLLNAGRGMGYCYLSPAMQERFIPINAGWRAGQVPFDSFFGPEMKLSPTASRFDSSISWLAAVGNVGWHPVGLPEQNQSTIVAVPLGHRQPAPLLRALSEQGIVCSARDGNLRLAVHFYNHEDDVDRLAAALANLHHIST